MAPAYWGTAKLQWLEKKSNNDDESKKKLFKLASSVHSRHKLPFVQEYFWIS